MPLVLDQDRLRLALALAEGAIGLSDPNPRVGCIIGRDDGTVLGQGHTQRVGEAHAEVVALRDAASQGVSVHGATAWVTLEPCSHQGRTPPCCDALIAAGIGRVVLAIEDPNPLVAGRGTALLRAAGINVDLGDAAIAAAARELNIGFFSRMTRGRPWVRVKVAATLDGITALHNGVSQWITGEEARIDGHTWRRRAGAILTGIGTVLADDPRLDVRLVPTALQPLRVVLDSELRTPASARLLAAPGRAWIVGARDDVQRRSQLVASGAEVQLHPGGGGRVDLAAVIAALAASEVNEVHVEGGVTLNGALLRSGLADELLIYLAPKLLGDGLPMVDLGRLSRLDQGVTLEWLDVVRIGSDLRVRVRCID